LHSWDAVADNGADKRFAGNQQWKRRNITLEESNP